MKKVIKKTTYTGLLLCAVSTPTIAEPVCHYNEWSEYPSQHQSTPLLKHNTKQAYMFRSKHVQVDADGAPNAYHPGDINLNCIRDTGFKGLDCPANAGYPRTSWWPDVLVVDANQPDKAYIQTHGEFSGYFVSKTSLFNRDITDITNPARYVDSTKIPYFVFPGSFHKQKGTGRLGDLGYAINLTNGKTSAFTVADIGPSKAELGEMSIELAKRMGGQTPNARTGAGAPKGEILYVIFPYSSRIDVWPLTLDEIEQKAAQLLEQAGGFESAKLCQ